MLRRGAGVGTAADALTLCRGERHRKYLKLRKTAVTIHHLLKNSAFDPEEIDILASAFNAALFDNLDRLGKV